MSASKSLLKFIGTMSDKEQQELLDAIQRCEKETNEIGKIFLARKLESMHEWELAATTWKEIGKTQDADMCEQIARRIKKRK